MSDAHVPNLGGSDRRRMTVAVLGTLGGLASMFAVIGIMAWTNRSRAPLSSVVVTVPEKIEALRILQAENRATLSSAGADHLPIDAAMERVVGEYQQRMEPRMNADERR